MKTVRAPMRERSAIEMENRFWSDIRCDYCNDEGFWTVDAWKTPATDKDDGEEGSVIAYIDNLTARVIYIDPIARLDEYAQEVIKDKIKDIENNNRLFIKDEQGTMTMYFKTEAGPLVVQAEKAEDVGTNNVYVGLKPKDFGDDYVDLVGIRVKTDDFDELMSQKYELKLYAFDNPRTEDPTWPSSVGDLQLARALSQLSYAEKEEIVHGHYGIYWVYTCPDVGENKGGYYVEIYYDEDRNNIADYFCIRPEELKENPNISFWIKKYLGLEE